ncbi:hypothetical protein ACSBR1_012103 [Camellia fascicularis]
MTITNKGVSTMYNKILDIFTTIDLSSNKFKGEIPESIKNLKGLQLLNLSNNDISALLTFLTFLNVSNGHLTGLIPQRKQLTFANHSFEWNPGLCRDPLSRKCEMLEALPSSPPLNAKQDNDSAFKSIVDWIVICMGYVSGIVIGTVIYWVYIDHKVI